MDKMYSVLDIKIVEKKNMYGEIFDVNSLLPEELERYIDCLIMFESKKYWVSTIEHIVSVKRNTRTYKGKKAITELFTEGKEKKNGS